MLPLAYGLAGDTHHEIGDVTRKPLENRCKDVSGGHLSPGLERLHVQFRAAQGAAHLTTTVSIQAIDDLSGLDGLRPRGAHGLVHASVSDVHMQAGPGI